MTKHTEQKSLTAPRSSHFFMLHLQAFMNALGQLSRSYAASLFTFAVIGIALALPMGMNVLLNNLHNVTQGLRDSGQISLYLKTDISQQRLKDDLNIIKKNQQAGKVHYISPKDGLKDFAKQSGFSDVLSNLKHNPLPGVITVAPAAHLKSWQTQQLFSQLKSLPGVDKAEFDMAWLNRLNGIINIGHRLATLLLVLFALAVLLIIGNTIRLTTAAHAQEINVIKLVGGTDGFIRRPFLYSGALYGFCGGIIAWFIVDIAMAFIDKPIAQLASLYGNQFHLDVMSLGATVILLFGGAALGLIASWFAVSRNIRQDVQV
jgi:cell division transport system permease protein